MQRKVVITGAGVISSLGDSPAALHAALCQGRSGLRPVTQFPVDGLGCRQAGGIESFSPKTYLENKSLRALDRTARLVTVAAELALADSGWTAEMRRQQEVGLALGTMFCSVHTISEFDRRGLEIGPEYVSPMDFANTVINAAAGQAAIWHNLRGVNSTIAAGAASGLQAIGYGAELIRCGRSKAILAGGAEEFCFESFLGFCRAGMLCGSSGGAGERPIPFDARRNGFALGEGAALVMLEDAGAAAARGAKMLAEVQGFGCVYDGRGRSPGGEERDGITRAMRLAMNDARMAAGEVECLSASANGSILGDEREARAITAVFGERARTLPVTAIKSMLGETLGASGAMQVVDLIEALGDGVLAGVPQLERLDESNPLEVVAGRSRKTEIKNGLINAVGFDGHCSALVLSRCG